MKQGKQEWGRKLYAKDERVMVTWEWKSVKQGDRDEDETRGNKDEQRSVGGGMEIEQG